MEITIKSLDTIQEAAKEFINRMGEGKVFAFYGKMGAGKTTFIKALCVTLSGKDTVKEKCYTVLLFSILACEYRQLVLQSSLL